MILEQTVAQGTQWMLGAPAKPLPAAIVRRIVLIVASIDGIREAHLPQCYAEGFTPKPAQVLFLLLDASTDEETTMRSVGEALSKKMQPGEEFLDMLPLTDKHELLPYVRGAKMMIYQRPKNPEKPSFFRRLFGR
jgi:hypothetical protein